jgi:hypothetical protein
VTLLRALPDIDVPGTEFKRPRHGLLLVLEGLAGQVEVHLIRAGLLLLGRLELDAEPGVITRQPVRRRGCAAMSLGVARRV